MIRSAPGSFLPVAKATSARRECIALCQTTNKSHPDVLLESEKENKKNTPIHFPRPVVALTLARSKSSKGLLAHLVYCHNKRLIGSDSRKLYVLHFLFFF